MANTNFVPHETVVITQEVETTIVTESNEAIIVEGVGLRGQRGPAGLTGPQGPSGPVGPQGPATGTSMLTFSFTVPEVVWTIPHNLGSKAMRVELFEADGVVEKEGNVLFIDDNTVQVEWFYPETGLARLFY